MKRFLESRQAPIALVGVPLLLVFALALTYPFLAVPSVDDFCRAAVERGGALRQMALWYQHWSGRWMTSLFYSWVTPRIGIFGIGYGLALVVALATWLAAFRLAAGLILGSAGSKRDRWIVAILLFAVFWCGAPGISEVGYWFSGAFEYAIPSVLLIASLRLLAAIDRTRRGLAAAILAGAIGVLTSGGHEFAGALGLGGAFAGILGLLFLGRRRVAAYWALAAALMIAGLALNHLAPGNEVRRGLFPLANDVARSLHLTFGHETTPLRWLVDPRLLALTGLLLLMPSLRSYRPSWLEVPLPWLILIPGITVAAVFSGWFLAAFALGHPPPGRLQSMLYAVFVIGWAATVLVAAARLRTGGSPAPAARLFPSGAAAMFGLALVTSGNVRAGVQDLRHASGPWLRANEEMFAAARAAPRASAVILQPPSRTPRLLVGQAFPDDPASHANRCLAKLLDVESVRAAPGKGARRIWRGE